MGTIEVERIYHALLRIIIVSTKGNSISADLLVLVVLSCPALRFEELLTSSDLQPPFPSNLPDL